MDFHCSMVDLDMALEDMEVLEEVLVEASVDLEVDIIGNNNLIQQ